MSLSRSEVAALLAGADDKALFTEADAVRAGIFGRDVYLRGIVEFSSVCDKRCQYCGLRAPNAKAGRYRLAPEDILAAADLVPDFGLGTVVLQSGDDPSYDADTVCRLVQAIKSRHDVAVTLSLGIRPPDELARFRDAGADRYLLKLETTDQELYARMRPGEDFSSRIKALETLQNLGYEVGSGVITGLPGMDTDMLARDILFLTDLGLEMIAVGPFVPHPDTPLGDEPHGGREEGLRAMALLRLLNPWANIPATSALDALSPDGRKQGLEVGGNVLMPSVTPEEVRGRYGIYPGKNTDTAMVRARIDDMMAMVRGLGLNPSPAQGFSPRSTHEPKRAQRHAPGHHPDRAQERGQVLPD